ncbi:MAG: protein translocase subunit SecF [Alphaproteobacteria bacterium]|nr:protein translocase subunit SecF [Alphaproteobacteria bacterium]
MAAFPIKLIPADTKIDFIGSRKIAYIFSGLLMLVSVGFFAFQGLNFGIDFKGGILIEVRTPGPANIDALRGKLSGLGLGEVALQEFGQATDVLIRIERQPGGEEGQKVAVATVKTALGSDVASYRRTEFVGPKVGGELIEAGILAVVLSLLAIMVYVWFRFEWQFSIGAIVALTHDVISTIGVFSITEHEFNLATVAAILTIAGYSINDTVVVFDRIRENLRKFKAMPIEELLNLSLNQTLSRTLLTSITTLLALLAIFFFGGAVIQDFAFALIWGVVIGTFSSIFVASPVVMMLNIRESISGGTIGGNETSQGTPAE